jgi:diguanylate cyclase (GGDEF)-like protein
VIASPDARDVAAPEVRAAFDRIASLTADVLGAPASAVSVVDDGVVVLRAASGWPARWGDHSISPGPDPLGAVVVEQAGPVVIESVAEPPWSALAGTGAPGVAAYAGVPLITSGGRVIGTLAAADREPRAWSKLEIELMSTLASFVVANLELRRALRTQTLNGSSDLVGTPGRRLPPDQASAPGTAERWDPVSGRPNRDDWDEQLPRELARAKLLDSPVSVVIADLTQASAADAGTVTGDQLLYSLAESWSTALREVDLLARFATEGFALLLPDCTAGKAGEVVARLGQRTPSTVTVAIGIAEWDGRETSETLAHRAVQALSEATRERDRTVTETG